MDVSITLIVVMVSGGRHVSKLNKCVPISYVHFFVYQLYLSKARGGNLFDYSVLSSCNA